MWGVREASKNGSGEGSRRTWGEGSGEGCQLFGADQFSGKPELVTG